MNKARREVINVWPVSGRRVFKALVKVTFAESVSVFPLKLMEGNHGYFLGFPKIMQTDGTRRPAGRFLYQDANRMLTDDVLRSYIPGTPICREFQMKESLCLCYRVYPQPVQADCLVATASLEINHQIRIEGIRLFQLRDGVRMILYEFYLFLSSPVVVEYVRNMMKRNRKRDSFLILTSQNVEDFLLPSIREYTKPLLSIPAHRFLFYPGTVEESEYCDLLQLEECEFQVIRTASRARCLFQCGNERYKLLVQAPDYKQEMFGTEGGR